MVHGYPQGLSKSDIGISDTLKILIENAQNGKNNPKIVKKLIKIVIEDIEYEIYLTGSYIDNLSSELSRFKQIESYREYMEKAKKEKDKNYYLEGMKVLLRDGETIENYMNIYNEYQDAYNARKAIIDNLYKEIKIIKKLKV